MKEYVYYFAEGDELITLKHAPIRLANGKLADKYTLCWKDGLSGLELEIYYIGEL